MIPDEAVYAAVRVVPEYTPEDEADSFDLKANEVLRGKVEMILEAAAPHLAAKLTAEVAYQKARAEYFKYVPEIEEDPEGVQSLAEEMRAAREAFRSVGGKP